MRTDVREGTCRSCAARMLWATTPSGKANPLDVEPSSEGNVLLMAPFNVRVGDSALAVTLSGDALEWARGLGLQLRTSHFATCPDRDKHRKRS